MLKSFHASLVPIVMTLLIICGVNPVMGKIQQYGHPHLDEVYIKPSASLESAVSAYQASEADFIENLVNWTFVSEFSSEEQTILSSLLFHYCRIELNCRSYVPDDAEQPDAGRSLAPLNWSGFRQSLVWAGLSHAEKEAAILEIIGGPLCMPNESPVPPSLGVWHWEPPQVGCNFTKAWEVLQNSGFYIGGSMLYQPNGIPVRAQIDVMSPAEAPTSVAFTQKFIDKWNDFMDNYLGVTNCDFNNVAITFYTIVDSAFLYRNFDAYFLCWSFTKTPGYLYDFFHSSNDYPWGDNSPGLNDVELDALLDTIKYGMVYEEKLQACHEAQGLLILELCPQICIYTRFAFSAFKNYTYYNGQPKWLENMVALKGFGTDNPWTWALMHWNTAPTGGRANFTMLANNPTSLHPGWVSSGIGLSILEKVMDSPLTVNFANDDLSWIACNWTIEPFVSEPLNVVRGMKARFQIRGGVLWHDLMPVTVEDIKFALSFLPNFPNREEIWKYLLWSEVVDPYTLDVYLNSTSQQLFYDLENLALMFPKHIYGPNGWLEQNGYDPVTADVWNITYTEGEARKALIGCGPYVFDYWNTTTSTAHIVKFLNYWVDGPLKQSIVTTQRVDPDTALQYYVEIVNTGSKDELTGKLMPAVIDGVEIQLDNDVIQVIVGPIVIRPAEVLKFGPFHVHPAVGFHYLHCRTFGYGEQYDSYSCPLWVTPREDVNSDFYVGIDDIFTTASCFGAEPLSLSGSEVWDERCDINGDHYIGIDDIYSIASKFGQGT